MHVQNYWKCPSYTACCCNPRERWRNIFMKAAYKRNSVFLFWFLFTSNKLLVPTSTKTWNFSPPKPIVPKDSVVSLHSYLVILLIRFPVAYHLLSSTNYSRSGILVTSQLFYAISFHTKRLSYNQYSHRKTFADWSFDKHLSTTRIDVWLNQPHNIRTRNEGIKLNKEIDLYGNKDITLKLSRLISTTAFSIQWKRQHQKCPQTTKCVYSVQQ